MTSWGAGRLIRPAALAMIEAYLRGGHDVVLPQLLTDPAELARFEAAAIAAGAEFIERMLVDSLPSALARFHRRGAAEVEATWHDQVREIVRAQGGEQALERTHHALERLLLDRPAWSRSAVSKRMWAGPTSDSSVHSIDRPGHGGVARHQQRTSSALSSGECGIGEMVRM